MSTSTGKRKRHSVTSTVRATSDHWLEMMPADEVTNGVRREAALWVRNKYLGIKVLRDFAHVPGGPFEAEVKDVWGNARTGQMLFHLGYSDGDKEYITWREINKLMISTAEIQRQRQRQLQYAQQQSCGNSGGGRGGSATQTQAKTKAKTKAQTKSQTKSQTKTPRLFSSTPPGTKCTPPLTRNTRLMPPEPKTGKRVPSSTVAAAATAAAVTLSTAMKTVIVLGKKDVVLEDGKKRSPGRTDEDDDAAPQNHFKPLS